ncbi:hypothetical protein OSB04_027603 [Centaurea solstitialis]|uniref:Uncharacterized protein n=1 Tax=Centaurea solstitialis TaxID=347529 RepID=A0AA38VZV1_9ASTR|nr:hypothetical protein OSB04_027603 [Centaurea solstitialis]
MPNKVLIEVAKQMPNISVELLHITKSRHPYIECTKGYVVSTIRMWVRKAGDQFEEFEEANLLSFRLKSLSRQF